MIGPNNVNNTGFHGSGMERCLPPGHACEGLVHRPARHRGIRRWGGNKDRVDTQTHLDCQLYREAQNIF